MKSGNILKKSKTLFHKQSMLVKECTKFRLKSLKKDFMLTGDGKGGGDSLGDRT